MDSPARSSGRAFGAGGPTLAEVGEHQVLQALTGISREAPGAATSGDDAAVWTPPPGCDLAVSIDALVEDVDFRRTWITPDRLGRRAFGVAVSDLAGTGAEPRHCVATLCASRTEQFEDVLEIQRGLCAAAAVAGCAVVGGDLSAIDGPMVIDVCVVGELPAGRSLRRSAGRCHDLLVVTGTLGRAAAGLRLLVDGTPPAGDDDGRWIAAQLDPPLRIREGRRLLDAGVLCAGDLSDGLAVDAARTAAAAGCAAELWADCVPVDGALRHRFGRDWLQLAIGGGEDFELLASMPAHVLEALRGVWPADLAKLTVVGRLVEGTGLRLLSAPAGAPLVLPPTTARHFS